MSHHQYLHGYPAYPGTAQAPAGQAQGQGQGQAAGAQFGPGNAQQYWAQQPHGYPAPYQSSTLGALLPRDRFMKGLLIGAAATYLLTNEQVQRTAIKGVVRAWSLLQGGVEEIKERFGDAEAELRHANRGQDV